jgi:NAD(P)-dependent dehydrogenase (short-subunit alcohol dehydrogenase family)
MAGVVITGGFGALGQAVAKAFKAADFEVALIDRAPVAGHAAEFSLGNIDLADEEQASAAFDQAQAALGDVRVLVNVAGAFVFDRIDGGDPTVWDQLFIANLKTCANMCRAAARRLPSGGCIINIGAAAAERAGAGMGAYAASKAGVARLTESLAAELGGRIRVNAVLPLIIDPPQNRREMPKVDPVAWTAPAAIADVILFLATDASRAINGALIPASAPTAPGLAWPAT